MKNIKHLGWKTKAMRQLGRRGGRSLRDRARESGLDLSDSEKGILKDYSEHGEALGFIKTRNLLTS
jgi:hypothetical protein